MSFLEKGWFKKGEDKESLQDAVDFAVEKDKVAHIITKETLYAAKNIDDQEQNIAAQADEENNTNILFGINPEVSIKVQIKMENKNPDIKDDSIDSNYATKN